MREFTIFVVSFFSVVSFAKSVPLNSTIAAQVESVVEVRGNLGAILDLVPDSGAPSQAFVFLEKLTSIAFGSPHVELTLGFLFGGRGHIRRKSDGAILQSVFLSTKSCSTECQPNEPDGLYFPLENWMAQPATKFTEDEVGIAGVRGLCGQLTVVHGLFQRMLVMGKWDGVTNGDYWDDDYIKQVWRETGSSYDGVSSLTQQKGFEAAWNTVWYGSCYSIEAPFAATKVRKAKTLEDWCKEVSEQTTSRFCAVSFNGTKNGHMIPVIDIDWEKEKGCVVSNYNTGKQGNPIGHNVKHTPEKQIWEISGDPDAQVIAHTSGSNGKFWNDRGYNRVGAYCCREYKRIWPSYPDRKGAAWK